MSHEIHTIDATGKAPGRLATEVTRILIGKNKTSFTPHIDDGDHVQVVNAAKMVLTGKKLTQKVYSHHTTYAAGLRQKKLSTVWAEDPGDVLRRAVSRMLPKNKHRSARLKRLVVTN
ncbi:50S ribosomal protein L13 [Candidatus Uhrbacteria bacterium]|nr:50S ribosomal protein L13 [Candidatus Uhrbacteria bacterium]